MLSNRLRADRAQGKHPHVRGTSRGKSYTTNFADVD